MRKNDICKKTLPLNLLVENRQVLVVGGGKVASHKLKQLLEAGTQITVVALEVNHDIQELASKKEIILELRCFQDQDLCGKEMVIVATNDHELNRSILQQARQKRILIGMVDDAWYQGDFVSPAVIRQGAVTVAISSGGLSCRLSRMIKQGLNIHLNNLQNLDLVIIGLSHRTMELARREKFMLTEEQLLRAAKYLQRLSGIQEFMLLLTCNRVEFIGIASLDEELKDLILYSLGLHSLMENEYYVRTGEAAFEHLAFTLSGLYSQTPGEKHIVAQVKDALQKSKEQGWSSNTLNEWINSSLHISRQIRRYLQPLFSQYEIERLTIQFLQENLGEHLKNSQIAILGTGVVGKQLVMELQPLVKHITWGWHQHCPKIDDMDNANKVTLCQMEELVQDLSKDNVIICATSATTFILQKKHQKQMVGREQVWLIDLCNPRNIDPDLQSENIKVVNLDDLKYWFRREIVDVEKMFSACHQIVQDNIALYQKLLIGFEGIKKK